MDILDAIRARKSIRGYKTNPVPRAVLGRILTIACQAPSAVNNQPWEFAVVTGDPLLKIKQENVRKLNAGELPEPKQLVIGWPNDSIYRTRQVDLAKHIFQIMGIPREDKVKRAEWMERGFRYFDAPAAIIIFVDSMLSEAGPLLDVGAVMQNICLAALHFGLGTCIHDQGILYPDVVRRYTGIPETKRLIIAISIGYPDNENIANTITSTRESIDGLTSWSGFA